MPRAYKIDKKVFEQLYISGLSFPQIADHFHACSRTVLNFFKNNYFAFEKFHLKKLRYDHLK